ncbi:MAG: NAD(P)H-dependent oxidoreductase, partial [Pseudomonadales bacterium]|nr:NAD(P)H-dependent oxidoreductase [Pseudomonadales bacterium]
MKYCIISGSHRAQSNSNKIARYVEHNLQQLDDRNEIEQILVSDINLPMWSEDIYDPKSDLSKQWMQISMQLKISDAFIIISPEWAGMAAPALKNFLLFCDNGELSHKPAMIVTVSAGEGGSYPVVELRSTGYKNNHVCFIPEHIIVRHADHMFNDLEAHDNEHDQQIRQRMDYGLRVLSQYSEALQSV